MQPFFHPVPVASLEIIIQESEGETALQNFYAAICCYAEGWYEHSRNVAVLHQLFCIKSSGQQGD